jgi:hypothetical protein
MYDDHHLPPCPCPSSFHPRALLLQSTALRSPCSLEAGPSPPCTRHPHPRHHLLSWHAPLAKIVPMSSKLEVVLLFCGPDGPLHSFVPSWCSLPLAECAPHTGAPFATSRRTGRRYAESILPCTCCRTNPYVGQTRPMLSMHLSMRSAIAARNPGALALAGAGANARCPRCPRLAACTREPRARLKSMTSLWQ